MPWAGRGKLGVIINRRVLTKGLGLTAGALMLEPKVLRAASQAEAVAATEGNLPGPGVNALSA